MTLHNLASGEPFSEGRCSVKNLKLYLFGKLGSIDARPLVADNSGRQRCSERLTGRLRGGAI